MSSNNTISISTLDTLINSRLEERQNVQKALETANAALKNAQLLNKARKEIVNEQVSKLQSELNTKIKEELQIQKSVYDKTLCELGMSPNIFPLETAIVAADKKVLTPALESIGKVGRVGFNLLNGVKERIASGFGK
jgi:hypothetical protein